MLEHIALDVTKAAGVSMSDTLPRRLVRDRFSTCRLTNTVCSQFFARSATCVALAMRVSRDHVDAGPVRDVRQHVELVAAVPMLTLEGQ